MRQATLRAVRAWQHPAIYVHGYLPPDLLDRRLEQDRVKQAEGESRQAIGSLDEIVHKLGEGVSTGRVAIFALSAR